MAVGSSGACPTRLLAALTLLPMLYFAACGPGANLQSQRAAAGDRPALVEPASPDRATRPPTIAAAPSARTPAPAGDLLDASPPPAAAPGMAARPTASPLASDESRSAAAVTNRSTGSITAAARRVSPPVAPPEVTTDHWQPPATLCSGRLHRDAGRWMFDDFVEWNADGSVILFTRGPLLYGTTADGARAWPVADASHGPTDKGTAGTMVPFDLSPDGRRVVYGTCQFPRRVSHPRDPEFIWTSWISELVVADVDGTDARRVTDSYDFDSHPAWSPDGGTIAFWANRHVRVIPVDGSAKPLNVGRAREPSRHAPVWSPDGGRLAVALGLPTGGVAIDVINLEDGAEVRLTDEAASAPTWSPDGERLAFAKAEAHGVALYTIGADGSDAQRLAPIEAWRPSWGEPDPTWAWIPTVAWSPDGSRILLVVQRGRDRQRGAGSTSQWITAGEIVVVTVAGPERGRVTPIAPDLTSGGPRGEGFYGLVAAAWSPDGSRLAVVARRRISDLFDGGGNAQVFTAAADGSDRRAVTELDRGQLHPWHAPRPYDPDHLRACRKSGTVPDAASNPGLVDDCAALLALWTSGSDAEYANWSTPRPLGEWDGVGLGGSPPRVRELRLTDARLGGRDARALRWLTELRRLELSNSGLSYIPRTFGQLWHLEELRLGSSRVRGRVPAELGQLANLRVLDLSKNELTGSIPAELEQLSELTHLDLTGNQLTGSIPAELGQLTNLTYLDLSFNQLTGAIPRELGQLNGQVEVRLAGNQLTGCVPPELPVADRAELGLPGCEAGT